MTRTNAREIAVHLTFELSFTNQTADELLDTALTRATFALIGEEEPLYAEYPNAKQREYIEKNRDKWNAYQREYRRRRENHDQRAEN